MNEKYLGKKTSGYSTVFLGTGFNDETKEIIPITMCIKKLLNSEAKLNIEAEPQQT